MLLLLSRFSCVRLCATPQNGSPLGSPVPGILQARTLEWVAISFSNARKQKVKVKSLSRVQLSATSWTAAYQAPPSMGFSRQEYWSGVPLHCSSLHLSEVAQSYPALCNPMDCSLPGSSIRGIFQAILGCHFLLQGIFLTQRSNPGLLHCRQMLNRLSHQESSTLRTTTF